MTDLWDSLIHDGACYSLAVMRAKRRRIKPLLVNPPSLDNQDAGFKFLYSTFR